jgi:hypothetical protein
MSGGDDAFWDLAADHLARPGVSRSTMMGFPCLRFEGDFYASWDRRAQALVIKLDAPTVGSMIADGRGEPFAPSGRRFREWTRVPDSLAASWPAVLELAFDHALRRRSP